MHNYSIQESFAQKLTQHMCLINQQTLKLSSIALALHSQLIECQLQSYAA